jgi:hypothetical protein
MQTRFAHEVDRHGTMFSTNVRAHASILPCPLRDRITNPWQFDISLGLGNQEHRSVVGRLLLEGGPM